MNLYLVRKLGTDQESYWTRPKDRCGFWTPFLHQAHQYHHERAAHISWTAVSRFFSGVEVVSEQDLLCGANRKGRASMVLNPAGS